MSRTLERNEEVKIDVLNSNYKEHYDTVTGDWKDQCIRKLLSRKEYRKGGRVRRRAIERKEIDFIVTKDTEEEQVITCYRGDRVISELTLTLINVEEDVTK